MFYMYIMCALFLAGAHAQYDLFVTAHPGENVTVLWHFVESFRPQFIRLINIVGTHNGTYESVLRCRLFRGHYPGNCAVFSGRVQLILLPTEALNNITAIGTAINVTALGFNMLNVTVNDANNYRITGPPLGYFNMRATLYVYQKPSRPLITSDEQPFVGRNVVLTCISSSTSQLPENRSRFHLEYTWNTTNLGSRYTSNGSSIVLQNPQIADNGAMFSCRSSEENSTLVSEVSPMFTLDLYYLDSIRFSDGLTEQAVVIGRNVSKTCLALCNPSCRYRWVDEQGALITTGNILVVTDVNSQTASTVYTCEATNQVRTLRKSFRIALVVKPDIVGFYVSHNPVFEGNRTDLVCITGNTTSADISISALDSEELVRVAASNQLDHTWETVHCSQAGRYECTAENANGIDSRFLDLDILCPPRVGGSGATNHKFVVDEGSAFTFKFEVLANPEIRLGDTAFGHLSPSGVQTTPPRNNIVLGIEGSSITVGKQSVTDEDYGLYTISAWNDYGHMLILFEMSPDEHGTSESMVGMAVALAVIVAVGLVLGAVWFVKRRDAKRLVQGTTDETLAPTDGQSADVNAFAGVELVDRDIGGETYDSLDPNKQDPTTGSNYQALGVHSDGRPEITGPDVYEEIRTFPK